MLSSLDNHWEGLTRFVENPLIPMDNNFAEQACAENNSAPPEDISSFLPWAIDKERLEYFQKPIVR